MIGSVRFVAASFADGVPLTGLLEKSGNNSCEFKQIQMFVLMRASWRIGGIMRKAGNRVKTVFDKFRKRLTIKDNDKGLTLVELMVAIVILTVVVLPTMSVFVAATKANSKARTELQSTVTANSVLESAKSFSIYVFDKQCNTEYNSGNASQFTLIAGQLDGSTIKSLVQAGGTCGQIEYESDGETVKDVVKNPAPFESKYASDASKMKFAYAINGIKQSKNTYDAVVVYEKQDYQDISVGDPASPSTYTESQVGTALSNYNKEYSITVYVYRHNKTGNPYYYGKNLKSASGALVTITGSKLDSALPPE